MIDPKLKGKVAIVTGANHGIGAATALALGDQGVGVFATYFRGPCQYSETELREAREAGVGGDIFYRAMQQMPIGPIVEQFREKGIEISTLELDLADEANISRLFDVCEKDLGAVDILVNNHTQCVLETFDPQRVSKAGSGIHLTTASSIDAHFIVNSRAYVLMMREYLQRYLEKGLEWGRIVNTSTDAAHCHPANISYAASKHAIESYSRSAACEMGRYGITVNVVSPGPIQTGYIPSEAEQEIAASTPLGRVGKPKDVADATVLLCSEQARWLTGQLLYVGGGYRMPQ